MPPRSPAFSHAAAMHAAAMLAAAMLAAAMLAAAMLALALPAACAAPEPYAVGVVTFEPGAGAGFGQDELPGVVLGPPEGGGDAQGGIDVLSLGQGGVIVLELGEDATDGPGPDLLVFENPFVIAATGARFTEPGEVAVSEDGEEFLGFPCAPAAAAPNGCAGYGVVHASSSNGVDPADPEVAGGDAFDLGTIGLERARFVRITDRGAELGQSAFEPTAGFDLDAVAAVVR